MCHSLTVDVGRTGVLMLANPYLLEQTIHQPEPPNQKASELSGCHPDYIR
jgi:hypothetical protein